MPGWGAGRRRLVHPLALAWFLFLALVLGGAAALFFLAKPPIEPVRFEMALAPAPPAVAAPIQPPKPAAAAPTQAPTQGSPLAQGSATNQPPTAGNPAQPTVPPPPAQAAVKIVRPQFAGHALVADPALIENTDDGPLPRIAADGRKPMQAYAPPVSAADLAGKKKIAIIIGGLGVSDRATQAAIVGLPADVTLAFTPYDDAQRWVNEARRRGHEVLLEVPMEPDDFPDSDPGPHTLRPSLSTDENLARLKWALTRFTGYTGVTNLLGSHFLASGEATEPVMRFLAASGLMFYDTGVGARSAAAAAAAATKTPYIDGSLQLDAIQSGAEIDRKLNELKELARKQGYAVGTGSVYPVTIARVTAWARTLRKEGFVLVPASSIVRAAP